MDHLLARLRTNLRVLNVDYGYEPDEEPSCRDLWAARVAEIPMEEPDFAEGAEYWCTFGLLGFELLDLV